MQASTAVWLTEAGCSSCGAITAVGLTAAVAAAVGLTAAVAAAVEMTAAGR